MPWQSPGGAFSRFSSISRAPGPSPCAPTQAGTPRPRPGDPRGPPARWRRLVDTPWELQGGLFLVFLLSPEPQGPRPVLRPRRGHLTLGRGTPADPPARRRRLVDTLWELQGAFEFFRSASSRRVGLSPRAGQGVPADPTAPASLQARPGTPRDPRGTSGPDFEFFALQARGAPAACQSLLSPLGALSRSGPGGRGSPRTPAPWPGPGAPGDPLRGTTRRTVSPLGPGLKHLSVGHFIDWGPRSESAAGSWPSSRL